ncbi:MAG: GntR family transcriptional regulator [Gammaproteobacteria bacterium]|mgnify:CR=1 FL=1|jgi:GntR family transcriptional regulator|nr:GntR family transcriptional regulator [Gammaproteobacteria bacterium]MDP6096227.1 GntR family transcriptional regulator [Gammaproteobacteria bacterium]|tara:strand:+ start:106 stop:498 length:393 start_codon:yes stop_codon:yes gene_type:complete
MLLHISEQSAETLQEQIIGQIRARILNGTLEPDYALPSIRTLAKNLRVSVITVQRAYEHLLNEEIIYSRRGKGYFVAPLGQNDKSVLAQQRFSQQLVNLIGTARRDGLNDQEVRQIFNRTLQSGDYDDNA